MLNIKRLIIVILIMVVIIVTIIISKNIFSKDQIISEIIPEEEISDDQMRQSTIVLYFKSENKLVPELRRIDVKELIKNPYIAILEALIEGPTDSNLQGIVSPKTLVNNIELNEDVLTIDFSNEYNDYIEEGFVDKKTTIEAITKTMQQLNEINSIKILINGKEI